MTDLSKIDRSKLTFEQQALLEQWEHAQKQMEVLGQVVEKLDAVSQGLGKLDQLEEAIKGIDVRPEVNVATPAPVVVPAPEVNVEAPVVNVPAPIVNVPETKIPKPAPVNVEAPIVNVDTKPIAKVIEKNKPLAATSDEGSVIYQKGTPIVPQRAPIDVHAGGATTVIEGIKGKSIRVVAGFIMASDETDMQFMSGDLHPLMGGVDLQKTTGFVWPYNPVGWVQTQPGDPLVVEQTEIAKIGGCLTYVVI